MDGIGNGIGMMKKSKSKRLGKAAGSKKGSLITKTWERCKSIGRGTTTRITRSKSWPSRGKSTTVVAPEGCFSVYVGPQMQRFVIKTEYVNHPLFKMLLEEAESEYGYSSQGPIVLPCNVDVFYKVLMEMDEETSTPDQPQPHGCVFVKQRSRSSYHLLSPSRMLAINHL